MHSTHTNEHARTHRSMAALLVIADQTNQEPLEGQQFSLVRLILFQVEFFGVQIGVQIVIFDGKGWSGIYRP